MGDVPTAPAGPTSRPVPAAGLKSPTAACRAEPRQPGQRATRCAIHDVEPVASQFRGGYWAAEAEPDRLDLDLDLVPIRVRRRLGVSSTRRRGLISSCHVREPAEGRLLGEDLIVLSPWARPLFESPLPRREGSGEGRVSVASGFALTPALSRGNSFQG
ncbi:MAG TPA: hypothetical protein VF590_19780 [Isosphaeraceae bacterium]